MCTLVRHYFEIVWTPEAITGVFFGFWWMNMMTMKTCYKCNMPASQFGSDPPPLDPCRS